MQQVIVGPEKSHAVRLHAKRMALAAWKKRARGFGRGYDSWRLAYAKALKCHKTGVGFTCVAAGAPCVIRQVPGRAGTI